MTGLRLVIGGFSARKRHIGNRVNGPGEPFSDGTYFSDGTGWLPLSDPAEAENGMSDPPAMAVLNEGDRSWRAMDDRLRT